MIGLALITIRFSGMCEGSRNKQVVIDKVLTDRLTGGPLVDAAQRAFDVKGERFRGSRPFECMPGTPGFAASKGDDERV